MSEHITLPPVSLGGPSLGVNPKGTASSAGDPPGQ
jgi:hypothetical protein